MTQKPDQAEVEKAAEEYADMQNPTYWTEQGDYFYYEDLQKAFLAGHAYATSHPAEGEAEFDEKAVEEKWNEIRKTEEIRQEDFITPGYSAYDDGILQLVRYQFEKSRAVIAAYKQRANDAEKKLNDAYEGNLKLYEEIKRLKGEINHLKYDNERIKVAYTHQLDEIEHLKLHKSICDVRTEELEVLKKDYGTASAERDTLKLENLALKHAIEELKAKCSILGRDLEMARKQGGEK